MHEIFSGMALWRMPGAEARGPFLCPRMIDCKSVCQGYPWRCVDGQCICTGGDPPPQQGQGEADSGPDQVKLP